MIQPSPYLLAYIDALGFSSLVKRKFSKKVFEYLEVTDSAQSRWAQEPIRQEIIVRSIGDAQILMMPIVGHQTSSEIIGIDDPDFEEKFWNFAYAVGEIQVNLALNDIWTRGAIVYDMLLVREHTIIGPAFHRAYYLEESKAIYPRVVVDGQIFTSAGKARGDFIRGVNSKGRQSPLFTYAGCSRMGQEPFVQDVPTFIDFLDIPPISGQHRIHTMDQVAYMVAKKTSGDMNHFSKYQWLAQYLMEKCAADEFGAQRGTEIIERLKNG